MPTLITTAVNVVAVVVAWYLQQVVSAFYSAPRPNPNPSPSPNPNPNPNPNPSPNTNPNQVVSAFYSALRGGKLFASALFSFLDDRGWLARLPCVAKPFEPDDSNLDEIVGYVLAAAGFVFQLQAGIHMASICRRIFDDTHAMTTRYTALACMYHIVAS